MFSYFAGYLKAFSQVNEQIIASYLVVKQIVAKHPHLNPGLQYNFNELFAEMAKTTAALARLSEAGAIEMGSATGARVLLIAGTPLNEPIVQYGPFVMNSREEIEQALRDFRDDRLTA
jgi:redox-sensitive bicupin YhaK (pirin superfamily)